jgi:HEAT repeat protein
MSVPPWNAATPPPALEGALLRAPESADRGSVDDRVTASLPPVGLRRLLRMAHLRSVLKLRVLLSFGVGTWAGALALTLANASCASAQADAGSAESEAAEAADKGARGEQAFQAALARLESPQAAERVSAADELGKRGYRFRQQISGALRPLLSNDPEAAVRAAAGRALGRLGSREAVPQLVAALDDRSVEVRVVAAAALWRLPDPSAVPSLLKRADDADKAVREWSALALGVVADARAVPVLARLLNDPERAVRLAAVRSLGRVGHASALPSLVQYPKTGARDDEEKDEVVNSIVTIVSPERVAALTRLLEGAKTDPRQRVRVAMALGKVGDTSAVPTLRKLSKDGTAAVRDAAKEALAALQARSQEQAARPAKKGDALAADAARP